MGNVLRVALPGYNAETDTNLDHFALNTSQDNILIKEKTRGSKNIAAGGTHTITHSLGYIPFFLVYINSPDGWELVPHYFASVSVPAYYAMSDTNAIVITNNDGAAHDFKFYVFYDNIVGASSNTIVETKPLVKIAKSGVNADVSKDPNDYIFHSNLNTFKIVYEANVNISYTTNGIYTFNHNSPIANPTAHLVFIKFPDGFTSVIPGAGLVYSKDSAFIAFNLYMTSTQIGVHITGDGSPHTIPLKYYIFETPL